MNNIPKPAAIAICVAAVLILVVVLFRLKGGSSGDPDAGAQTLISQEKKLPPVQLPPNFDPNKGMATGSRFGDAPMSSPKSK